MQRRGFTLIEIMTTILIFGILVSITSYVYGKALERNRDIQRVSDLNNTKNALEQYYLEHRTYPYNTSYQSGLASHPWVAKYELERYRLDTCDSANGDPGKVYLAPNYITTLPEDPLNSIARSLNANCQLDSSAGYGQYIYASLAVNEAGSKKVGQYYLMARLERELNVSDRFPDIAPRYALTLSKINSWGLNYCSKENPNPIDSTCSHNYYLKNSNND